MEKKDARSCYYKIAPSLHLETYISSISAHFSISAISVYGNLTYMSHALLYLKSITDAEASPKKKKKEKFYLLVVVYYCYSDESSFFKA